MSAAEGERPEGGEGAIGSGDDHVVTRHRGLVGRTALVAGLTLLSRILGFVREVLTGALFGDRSAISDAFFTAWRVPNLFRRLLGEGALATALQASMTEADHDGGDAAGRRLFGETLRLALWLLVAATGGAMIVAWHLPDVMPVSGWAWLGADPAPVRDLMVRLMPFVLLVCLAAVCGGALQVRGHYAAPNVAPALMNVVWIVALVWVGIAFDWDAGAGAAGLERQWEMARWVAWGVLVGGVVQLAVHVPPLFVRGLVRPLPGEAQGSGGVEAGGSAFDVLRTAAPLALGAAVYQINVMVDGLMAEGLLRDGGPSALYYANRIQQFPLALVAIATTNAVFPSLKALGHTGRQTELRALHDRAQLGVVFLALPASVGLWVLSDEIAATLFLRGNYGLDGVERLGATLRMLAFALIPAGASGLAGRAYYACRDMVTPVRIAAWLLLVNVGLNAAFVVGLAMDANGLALATATTSWVTLALLVRGLRRRLALPSGSLKVAGRLARMAAAAAVAGVAARLAHAGVAALGGLQDVAALRSGPALGAAGLAGVAAYLVASRLLRTPEWGELTARLRRGRPRA